MEVNGAQNLKERDPMNECRILIIEDNAYVQEAFELTLRSSGLRALVVATAEEALEAVQHCSFDVIISDYRLPGMDGLEFFTVAGPIIATSTKVLISAYGFEDMGTDARTAGVDHFVVKPFSIHRLLLQLRNADIGQIGHL